jgi:aldehyde:ferredoxin oxidoreductase
MDTFSADRFFKERYGTKSQAAVIGPAGENLVLFASIMTGGVHGRAIGRCGLGAVMGSKYLKAVIVKGSKTVEVMDQKGIAALQKEIAPLMNADLPKTIRKFGTTGGVEYCEQIGNLPIKNWFQGKWPEGAKKISGQKMADTILVNNYACGRCALRCGRVVRAAGGDYDEQEVGGPEYETVGMIGSNCLIDDLTAIAKANELCNRYGMDTISAGGVIGFSMEAYERELITKEDLGGIELNWGDGNAMIEMIHQIALRKGWGDELANGVRKTAEKMGGIASEFAIHVKGLEPPAHDPRAKMSSALQLATSNRGACHLQAFTSDFDEGLYISDLGVPQMTDRFASAGKAESVIRMQNLMSMFDSLTCCKFLLFAGIKVNQLVSLLNCVTGWNIGYEEFFQTGERIFNLKRLYNTRLGVSRKDDNLPLRLLTHKRGGGTEALPPLHQMLGEYYEIRKWDEFGVPTNAKINELGL